MAGGGGLRFLTWKTPIIFTSNSWCSRLENSSNKEPRVTGRKKVRSFTRNSIMTMSGFVQRTNVKSNFLTLATVPPPDPVKSNIS